MKYPSSFSSCIFISLFFLVTVFVCALWQTCMGKDVTLHVSASNPAMLLYQKFGFKTEEYILDFYDKYYPLDSKECRHAFFLRLRRWYRFMGNLDTGRKFGWKSLFLKSSEVLFCFLSNVWCTFYSLFIMTEIPREGPRETDTSPLPGKMDLVPSWRTLLISWLMILKGVDFYI